MLTVPKRCHTGLGRRALLPSLFVLLIAACKGAEPVRPYEPITSPEKLFMSATLNHHAINLSTKAPFDTTHLSMVVSDARSQPLDGLPAPTFLSRDTAAVQVTPDGVLHARKAGQGILVIGEVTAGNVRHADTAIVNVTANPNPPVLLSLSIHPVPPDSAVLAYQSSSAASLASRHLLTTAGVTKGVGFLWSPPGPSARAQGAGGVPITNLLIDYRSLDATVASYYRQTLILSRPGQVALVASTTAYGVTKADTAVFTVSLPIAQGVEIVQAADGVASFKPSEIRLRPGGYVLWFNYTANGVDVSFDDPTHAVEITPLCQKFGAAFCGTGDIPALLDPLPSGAGGLGLTVTVTGRQLIAPGVYTYHSSAISASGRIIVTDSATTR